MRPKVRNTTVVARPTLKDLVPSSLYFSHPRQVAPPVADLPKSIRNEAFFINRRVYGFPSL
ncbi:hypothetical protein TELCIR_11565 [Teladorsagia circumcincta]|uniref:Uncharacterized protein n=1 Tax=Teladorsagia circumcincta TaxID=45464 RepID=A0A2G9UB34_TELCI|nr:hypothetical protein TELCIR_11565 [Teladorsagia circumcincta]